MYLLIESIGVGPHTSECTSSKGEWATNWEVLKGNLCILPCKQCVQEERMLLHLFALESKEGMAEARTWWLGCPSLLCHSCKVKDCVATMLQALDGRLRLEVLCG